MSITHFNAAEWNSIGEGELDQFEEIYIKNLSQEKSQHIAWLVKLSSIKMHTYKL